MYINNNNSFLYSPPQERGTIYHAKEINIPNTLDTYLKNFSERAQISFDSLSSKLPFSKKEELAQTLNSIGKAAAFSSMNGFDSQKERLVVSQLFGNFEGVVSDEAIKKMIFSKLNTPNVENAEFLQAFVSSLDKPLQSIDIRV
ncbi:MAG: hypothetical protein COA44_13510 [Arcobacter sp.]|nr:MAG: hypothetical protein COA44_13510 [Arcobacter sp.]